MPGLLSRIPRLGQGFNPFTTGYAQLVQSGADVILQYKVDGAFKTLATFTNTSVAAFTAYNLGGYSADGSLPGGTNLTGLGRGRDAARRRGRRRNHRRGRP